MTEDLYAFEQELWARADDPEFYPERLTDEAHAERPDGSTYAAYCGSVYVQGPPGWQLAQHQQTPIPADVR